MKLAAILVVVLALSACGKDSSPLNPSGTDNTAALHVSVDGTTCAGIGPVIVSIDGTDSGTTQPGGNGITKTVAVGMHHVGGRSTLYDIIWPPTAINVPRAGFTHLLHCR